MMFLVRLVLVAVGYGWLRPIPAVRTVYLERDNNCVGVALIFSGPALFFAGLLVSKLEEALRLLSALYGTLTLTRLEKAAGWRIEFGRPTEQETTELHVSQMMQRVNFRLASSETIHWPRIPH